MNITRLYHFLCFAVLFQLLGGLLVSFSAVRIRSWYLYLSKMWAMSDLAHCGMAVTFPSRFKPPLDLVRWWGKWVYSAVHVVIKCTCGTGTHVHMLKFWCASARWDFNQSLVSCNDWSAKGITVLPNRSIFSRWSDPNSSTSVVSRGMPQEKKSWVDKPVALSRAASNMLLMWGVPLVMLLGYENWKGITYRCNCTLLNCLLWIVLLSPVWIDEWMKTCFPSHHDRTPDIACF